MKRTTTTLLAASLLLGAAATRAGAQPTPPVRQQFGTGELPDFLKTFDLNNDGKLSIEERQAYEKALRERKPPFPGRKNPWDTDGDGKLSDAEKQAAREAIAKKIAEERGKRFDELDIDDDGFLTATELAGIPRITPEQVTRIIAHLDKDADGKVSKAEFLAVMAPVEGPIPPCPLPQPPPQFPIPAPAGSILSTFDTDHNGFVSPAELAAGVALVDANGDGHITPDEWRAYVLAHPEVIPPTPGPQPPPPNR